MKVSLSLSASLSLYPRARRPHERGVLSVPRVANVSLPPPPCQDCPPPPTPCTKTFQDLLAVGGRAHTRGACAEVLPILGALTCHVRERGGGRTTGPVLKGRIAECFYAHQNASMCMPRKMLLHMSIRMFPCPLECFHVYQNIYMPIRMFPCPSQ